MNVLRRPTLSRRAALRGASVCVALPALEAMMPRKARAATAPPRVVFFFTPNGTNRPEACVGNTTGPNFTLGAETAALEPLRKRLLVVSNVNMQSAELDTGDLHSVGMAHMLTGVRFVPAVGYDKPGGDEYNVGFGGGPSVDQDMGRRLSGKTRFDTLQFGIQTVSDYGVHPYSRMTYKGANQPVPAEDDPSAMFTRLFGDGTPAGMTDDGARRMRADRRSVLDFVIEDCGRLRGKIGKSDQQKIDQHLEHVRAIEKQLMTMDAPIASTCGKPGAKPALSFADKSKFPDVGKAQMELARLALACDLTRIATVQWSWARSELVHRWIPGQQWSHHSLSHAPGTDELSAINTWYVTQLASFAQALAATDDVDGRKLLDNTVVFWCGECALGFNHSFENARVFLIGDCAGFFKTGQHIKLSKVEPHNKLLVSLEQAMRLDVTSFGETQFGTGPLSQIHA